MEGSEGRWGEGENVKFVVFVNYYQDIFVSRHKRKYPYPHTGSARYLRALPSSLPPAPPHNAEATTRK